MTIDQDGLIKAINTAREAVDMEDGSAEAGHKRLYAANLLCTYLRKVADDQPFWESLRSKERPPEIHRQFREEVFSSIVTGEPNSGYLDVLTRYIGRCGLANNEDEAKVLIVKYTHPSVALLDGTALQRATEQQVMSTVLSAKLQFGNFAREFCDLHQRHSPTAFDRNWQRLKPRMIRAIGVLIMIVVAHATDHAIETAERSLLDVATTQILHGSQCDAELIAYATAERARALLEERDELKRERDLLQAELGRVRAHDTELLDEINFEVGQIRSMRNAPKKPRANRDYTESIDQGLARISHKVQQLRGRK